MMSAGSSDLILIMSRHSAMHEGVKNSDSCTSRTANGSLPNCDGSAVGKSPVEEQEDGEWGICVGGWSLGWFSIGAPHAPSMVGAPMRAPTCYLLSHA